VWLETFPKVLSLCFPDLKVKFNKTDYIAEFPNGSQIFFAGLDDGQRTEKILGSEYSTLYFNEASQIDYTSVQMALTRLAEKNDLKKRAWFDFNPPSKSHWSYYLFIKKLDPIDDVPLAEPDNYAHLQMNPTDNIDNIDSDYIKMLEAMPEKERNRFLLGEFNDESNGQVYYAFRREDHVVPLTRKPGTVWAGLDFNVQPMTCVIGQYNNGSFEIVDEIYLENSDTYKMADELKRRGYTGARLCPDSTGRNRKTSGKSDFQILQESGFVIESTSNPFKTDRINNVNRLLTAGKIKIDPKCKKLINDLSKVVWKNNEPDQSGANKMLTHISDSLGYLCWKLEPIAPLVKHGITTSER
jgi:PBSX family phage terminase large subunit